MSGDQVVKTSHDDPDVAIVITAEDGVQVAYEGQFDGETVPVAELAEYCASHELSVYPYSVAEVAFADQQ